MPAQSKFVKRYRIKRKAKRLLGIERRDASDRADFLEQCVSELVDEGSDPEDAMMVCQLLYDEEEELNLFD